MTADVASASALPIAVSIPCVESPKSFLAQTPTKYVVEVEAFGLKCRNARPFEDFEKFHGELTQFIRGLPSQVRMKLNQTLPPLPQTYWIGNELAATVEDRRAKLEEFLQKALLQSPLISDSEERLWRFLMVQPPAAAAARLVTTRSCGPWLQTLWETSFQGDGLVALRDAFVEDALLQIVKEAITESGEFANGVEHPHVNSVCGLLERVFVSVQDRERSEALVRTSVESLLCVVRCTCSDQQVRDTASSALLQLVRVEQKQWQDVLFMLIDNVGVERLAAVADVSRRDASEKTPVDDEEVADVGTGPTTRLVAELLVRGFDGPVVERFIDSELADGRKRLLNSLFLSPDLFVKLAVGVLLARLVCEPGYVEAAKAQSGLRAIAAELMPKFSELAGTGIGQLLLEDHPWKWLCKLLRVSQPAASGYALILMVHAVKPSPARVLETPGVQDSLLYLAGPHSDPIVRNLAAGFLLEVYRAEADWTPADRNTMRILSDALTASTEETLVVDEERHASLAFGVQDVRGQCGAISCSREFLGVAQEGIAKVRLHADSWTSAVDVADSSITTAEIGQNACLESLRSNRSKRDDVISVVDSTVDGEGDQLLAEFEIAKAERAAKEREVEERTRQLETMVQKKMDLTRSVSECNDEAQQWRDAAEKAEDREKEPSPIEDASEEQPRVKPGLGADECWQKHREAMDKMSALRTEVDRLDHQLQHLSEPLPSLRESAERLDQRVKETMERTAKVRQRHAAVLGDWDKVLVARRACAGELRGFSECLDKARGTLDAEHTQRRALRGVIQELVQSLVALDGELEALGRDDEHATSNHVGQYAHDWRHE